MANAEVSLSYAYDALNRLTQVTNHTLNQAVTYQYDAAGNLVRMGGPQGDIFYLYEAENRLREQRDPATGSYRFAYDDAGRRTELQYPNGLRTGYEYDDAARLAAVLTRNAQGLVVDGYSYQYDDVGNRTAMSAVHEGANHLYEYDATYRLTRWQRGTERFEAYTYDRVGDRVTISVLEFLLVEIVMFATEDSLNPLFHCFNN